MFRVQLESADGAQKVLIQNCKEQHLRSGEAFYSSLRTNTQLASSNSHIRAISFDFQQNLPLPHVPIGEVFYMRQLWLYLFGIHDCGMNSVVLNCWPQSTAGKGSDEDISCLDRNLTSLPNEVTTLFLYSDGCPGQNKNINVVHYLFTLVKLGRFEHIQHHFPVRGHSFLPNDRDFGRTETKKSKIVCSRAVVQHYEDGSKTNSV